jgi:hypothetical protein
MTVVISSSLVLSRALVGDAANGNNPIIGYQNLVTTTNITTTTVNSDFPASNLANPATDSIWKGVVGSPSADDEYITVQVDTNEDIDYVGIARHNFGSGMFPVSVEVQATDGGAWVEVVTDTLLADDSPVIFRFTPQAAFAVRVRLQPPAVVNTVPFAAVVYVGKLLILQRRIYVGHIPIPYGRQTRVVTGKSENSNFLGRIIVGEGRSSGVNMMNLTPAWYRTYMDPFIAAAQRYPFFFGWRPLDYPYETGYAWITDDPQPQNQRTNGMVQISFKMMGIV